MPQAFDYPELEVVADDDVVGVIDVDDATDNETGSTKHAKRRALFGGPRVLTAAELSSTSALQNYVDDCLDSYGFCQLPPGVIDITGTINVKWRQGGIIRGCGPNPMPTYAVGNGFNNPALTSRHSTIIRRATGSGPIFDLDGAYGFTLQHFGMETDGVGVHYNNDTSAGYPSFAGLFERLSFAPKTDGTTGGTAIQAGTVSDNNNAADLEIRSCIFTRQTNGLLVKHLQGLNWVFSGNNWFGYCKNAINLENGGCVYAEYLSGYAVETWLRVIGGGHNNRTNMLNFIFTDRQASQRPAVVVDFSSAVGSTAAIVNAVKMTLHLSDGDNWPDHNAMLLPADHASLNVDIITNNTEAWARPGGTSWTPVVADNPFDA